VKPVPFGLLDPAQFREVVRRALAEDLGWGDVTTNAIIRDDTRVAARIVAREPCVIAGLDVAAEAFRQLDPVVEIRALCPDGQSADQNTIVATLVGRASPLLTANRTAVNFLQRLCGIATLTRRFVEASGGRVSVRDTRETTPGLRVLEKYAVRVGGGVNHRFSLDDGVLITKDHVTLAGGIDEAVRRVKAADPELPIQVEVSSLREVTEAIDAGVTLLLLDAAGSVEEIREAVRRCQRRAKIEVAGLVTLERVRDIANSGADFASVGALTHSAPAIAMTFELDQG